jgi:UDP-N-acetylglucosamine kinase
LSLLLVTCREDIVGREIDANDGAAPHAGASRLAEQRADAFDRLPALEALAKHPQLDGAYAQLRDAHQRHAGYAVADENSPLSAVRERLFEELRLGGIPQGSVTRAESERVIELAAADRGIKSIRDAADLQRDVRGEVVAVSSHHSLVKIGDGIAVRFHQDNLDRGLDIGEQVAIKHDQVTSKVYELSNEPQRQGQRDLGYGREIDGR